MAERVIGVALVALAVYLAWGAMGALASGAPPEQSPWATGLLVASVVVLPGVARAKQVLARQLDSASLRLDSVLTLVAAILALISLASALVATAIGLWWADAAAAIVVSAIIAREGLSTFRASRA